MPVFPLRIAILLQLAAWIGISGPLAPPAMSAPPRGFVGVNIGAWDGQVDTPAVAALLRAAGITALRWPGGSTSDGYDWTTHLATTTPQFADLASKVKAEATITTNFGTGSPQMAAAFAAYCNAMPDSQIRIGRSPDGRDWRTSGYWAAVRAAAPLAKDDGLNHLRARHPAPFAFRNWEIGNECFGAWETDRHRPKHDPVVYALFALDAMRLMHRIDPKLRVGVVVTDQAGANADDNQECVRNPHTGHVESDWNSVVFSTLASHGASLDFVAMHHYAQQPGAESDFGLMRDVGRWPAMIAQIRRSLTDYFPGSAARIGVDCTECNSVAINPGPQTTGEANSRYYAQVAPIAEALGFESFIWWDLHNGPSTSGHDTHSPLNNYSFGDYGIVGWGTRLNKPYPVYYAIQRFATHR